MSCSRVIAVGLAAAAIAIGADGGEPPSSVRRERITRG